MTGCHSNESKWPLVTRLLGLPLFVLFEEEPEQSPNSCFVSSHPKKLASRGAFAREAGRIEQDGPKRFRQGMSTTFEFGYSHSQHRPLVVAHCPQPLPYSTLMS
jgi:hypothetical protein